MTAPDYYNSIKQIRVTELLPSGAADPSATAKTTTNIKDLAAKPVYIDGEELEQTAGDVLVCSVTKEDTYKGHDLDLELATHEFEVALVIAGGDAVLSGPDTVGIESSVTTPGPFRLEAWVTHYDTTASVEGLIDGYLKISCPFCTGRWSDEDHGEKKWGQDKFAIKARQNPTSGDGAYKKEIVAAIT